MSFIFLFVFNLTFFTSCNNDDDTYYVEKSVVVDTEEEEEEEEEDGVNTEDEIPVIPISLVDDNYTITQDFSLEIIAYNNDENLPDFGTIENTNPENGVIDVNNNNTPENPMDDMIIYTPNKGFSGLDSFEYTICDANNLTNCDTALVTILVEPKETDINTELKAFPSALGDGAYTTTGGRGGVVVHVTNLNNSGAGSFREALDMTIPRIIVFDVSGVINLSSLIAIDKSNSNVTIAGQTAPEGGITIDGGRLYVSGTTNIICRYIRFKGGDSDDNDSLTVTGNVLNQVWDHCSFGFGTDEGASWYSGTTPGTDQNNITVQRCLWNENSKGSILGKLAGNGGTPPTGSFIYNMFYNSGYRFPNVAGGDGVARFDVINNISWNVKTRLIRGNGSFNLNHIGNYYEYGTRGITDSRTNLFRHGDIPQIYNRDNKIVAQFSNTPLTYTVSEMNEDNNKSWGFFQDGGGYEYGNRLPEEYFTDQQYDFLGPNFVPFTADEALVNVTANVGCNARLNADGSINENLDELDANALNQVKQVNYITKLSESEYIVPSIPSKVRAAGYDTDADGMPNIWERANGFNPELADGHEDADNDGYTNLEEFLNIVDRNN